MCLVAGPSDRVRWKKQHFYKNLADFQLRVIEQYTTRLLVQGSIHHKAHVKLTKKVRQIENNKKKRRQFTHMLEAVRYRRMGYIMQQIFIHSQTHTRGQMCVCYSYALQTACRKCFPPLFNIAFSCRLLINGNSIVW